VHLFTQQLIQLDLSGNAIGDEGANYLANSLENRQVSHIPYSLLLLAYIILTQELTDDDPRSEQTRSDGIKNLDVPLEDSKTVNPFLLATFFIIVRICSHRNSKSCILAGTKLGTKEQNISPRFYARTR